MSVVRCRSGGEQGATCKESWGAGNSNKCVASEKNLSKFCHLPVRLSASLRCRCRCCHRRRRPSFSHKEEFAAGLLRCSLLAIRPFASSPFVVPSSSSVRFSPFVLLRRLLGVVHRRRGRRRRLGPTVRPQFSRRSPFCCSPSSHTSSSPAFRLLALAAASPSFSENVPALFPLISASLRSPRCLVRWIPLRPQHSA